MSGRSFFFYRNTNLNWIHGKIESLKYFYFRGTKEQEEIESLPEIMDEFPVKEIQEVNEKYDKIREKARIKWILREIRRRERKATDTYSIATTLD